MALAFQAGHNQVKFCLVGDQSLHQANGRTPIHALADALAKVWGGANCAQVVTWPLSLCVRRKSVSNS